MRSVGGRGPALRRQRGLQSQGRTSVGTDAAAKCVAAGQTGASCRATSPQCDTGLGCAANRTCQALAQQQGACSLTTGCPDGFNCITIYTNVAECILDGGLGGPCRATSPTCNTGLACDSSSKCVTAGTLNGTCGTEYNSAPCADDLYCSDSYFGKCLARGAAAGACRLDGSCDTGLTCGYLNVCLSASSVADDGASCVTLPCKRGSTCLSGTKLCEPWGSAGASCRPTGSAQRCDANLTCNGSSCLAPVAVGQPCLYNNDVCASGAICPIPIVGVTNVCTVPGVSGAPCRKPPALACDAGLVCSPTSSAGVLTCQPATIPAGVACSTATTATTHCVAGSDCINSTCVAAGKLGGACRTHDPKGSCDSLLGCAGGRCVSGLAEGATCDPKSTTSACGLPDVCVTASDGTSKCAAAAYTEQVIAGLAFVDACTAGVHVPLKGTRTVGHAAAAINIPFAFQLWGSDFTTVWPSTRGALVFGAEPHNDDGVGNGYLPTDAEGPLVAPFWDEILLGDAPASDICFTLVGTAPNRQFVVEWAHAGRAGVGDVDLTFEVVLHETSKVIDLVYGSLVPTTGADVAFADGSRAAVGLQSGYDGVAVRHDGTVPEGGALRYTPN